MKNRLWHFGFVGVVFGLLAATGVASTPTFTLTLAGIKKPLQDAVVFRNLVSYIERGEIRPVVAATYPLQDLKEAQTEFMKKSHVGVFVVEIGE